MCKAMEDMRNEAAHARSVENARRMLASGKLTDADIAEFSGLTLEEVKALTKHKSDPSNKFAS